MKRRGYNFGVQWIVDNDGGAFSDDPAGPSVADVSGMISVALLADLFGKDAEDVARDVLKKAKQS